MKLRTIFLSALLAASWICAGAESLLKIAGAEATSIGIYIKDLKTDKIIAEENSRIALTPASVMKALTTASALSICGADTCFTTEVGLSGTIDNGICTGSLIVRATADPTIESDNFKKNKGFCDSIVTSLRRMGVRRIEGGVCVKQNLRDAGPNWHWEIEDVAWPYGAALFGFNYRDNTVTLTPATGETKPQAPGLEVCVEKAKDNDMVRGINSNRLTVYATNPSDQKWELNVTVPDPSAVFCTQMRRALVRAGIEVGDDKTATDSSFSTVYRHKSPALEDIMHSLMVRSDNLFAEGVLRFISPGSSRDAAIRRERSLWDERGISTKYTTINDGSGLARSNRLSPLFLGNVLEWMAKSTMAETYCSFFPRAGKEGTMRGFLAKSPLAGQIALKTGSVGGVQCYAGYKLDKENNPTHVIVIMVNSFFCPRREVRIASEKLLTDIFLKK